jgi:hypothetical protein
MPGIKCQCFFISVTGKVLLFTASLPLTGLSGYEAVNSNGKSQKMGKGPSGVSFTRFLFFPVYDSGLKTVPVPVSGIRVF